MAHHVGAGEAANRNALHPFEHPLSVDQAAELGLGQVDLAHIAGHYRPGTKADAGQEHLHLFRRGVLRLVQNHKGVVQGAPAHKGQRRNLQRLALKRFLHRLKAHQLVQRVIQGAQVGVNFLAQVARQKAQALAGLHRGPCQHDALHRAALQGVHRHGHGQVSLAGASRANAKGNVLGGDVVQVQRLVGGAGAQVTAPGLQRGVVGAVHGPITGQHQLHGGRLDRPGGQFVQRLQQLHTALGLGFGAVHLELFVPVGDLDLQGGLNAAQVGVHRAAQVRQAGVVQRGKQVAQDQADNSFKRLQ